VGFLCKYDRSWKNPKCCLGIWPYEQGLKILMVLMILEFPYTVYECIKLKDEWKFFDADSLWHIYVFITCLVCKLFIEVAPGQSKITTPRNEDDKLARKGIMNGFFIYLFHIFFEGFKCSWFTNFYTRMLLDEPSFDENDEVIESAKEVI
jgi:hypothetical protein